MLELLEKRAILLREPFVLAGSVTLLSLAEGGDVVIITVVIRRTMFLNNMKFSDHLISCSKIVKGQGRERRKKNYPAVDSDRPFHIFRASVKRQT